MFPSTYIWGNIEILGKTELIIIVSHGISNEVYIISSWHSHKCYDVQCTTTTSKYVHVVMLLIFTSWDYTKFSTLLFLGSVNIGVHLSWLDLGPSSLHLHQVILTNILSLMTQNVCYILPTLHSMLQITFHILSRMKSPTRFKWHHHHPNFGPVKL